MYLQFYFVLCILKRHQNATNQSHELNLCTWSGKIQIVPTATEHVEFAINDLCSVRQVEAIYSHGITRHPSELRSSPRPFRLCQIVHLYL